MGPFFEIIFFALLSAYIFYRLWGVLGQESEEDLERRELKKRQFEERVKDNVIPITQRQNRDQKPDVEEDNLKSGVKEGLRLLKIKEPGFEFSQFLSGAKGAYEMVLGAFAKGNLDELKLLLSPKVYDAFAGEIQERERRGETYEVSIEGFDRVDVDAININENQAAISVRFRTSQIMITRNAAGDIIENQAAISIPVTEIWTFTRTIGVTEPNWYLSQTRSA